jgi:Bacteriophage HK97-gp10, putative tail-component
MRLDGFDDFLKAVKKAADGGVLEQIGLWLEAMGMEFLDLIQDEIIRTETTDTRWLLNSFQRGHSENVWSISNGGLTLEVGTNVNYASFANDGHMQNSRFVPGYWKGDRFVYEPSSNTGMMLSTKFVSGSHYWDNALAIFEKMFEKSLDKLLQRWLDESF